MNKKGSKGDRIGDKLSRSTWVLEMTMMEKQRQKQHKYESWSFGWRQINELMF